MHQSPLVMCGNTHIIPLGLATLIVGFTAQTTVCVSQAVMLTRFVSCPEPAVLQYRVPPFSGIVWKVLPNTHARTIPMIRAVVKGQPCRRA